MPAAYLFQSPKYRPLDDNGDILPGAILTFWLTGTTTLATIYTDAALATPASNPLTADAAGEFAQTFLDPAITYRVKLEDSDLVEIYDLDPYTPARDYPTGSIVMFYGDATARDAAYPTSEWQVCDGTNGSPNLQDKFVLGAGGTYASGDTGGALTPTTSSSGAHDHGAATGSYTLLLADIPSHHHGIWTSLAGGTTYAVSAGQAGTHSFGGWQSQSSDAFRDNFGAGDQAIEDVGGDGGHTHTIATDGAHTHTVSTLPPFVALWFLYRKA